VAQAKLAKQPISSGRANGNTPGKIRTSTVAALKRIKLDTVTPMVPPALWTLAMVNCFPMGTDTVHSSSTCRFVAVFLSERFARN
jgi:hypothetical protein